MLNNPDDISNGRFENQILKEQHHATLVLFWAPWSIVSLSLSAKLTQIAAEYPNTPKFGRINVDHYPHIATQYQLHTLPSIGLFFKGHLLRLDSLPMPEKRLRELFAYAEQLGQRETNSEPIQVPTSDASNVEHTTDERSDTVTQELLSAAVVHP